MPHGTPVLYISSLRRLSLHGYRAVILDNLLSFLWKWNLLVLLPEPEQLSLFDTSLVTLVLFSQRSVLACATIYCLYFL